MSIVLEDSNLNVAEQVNVLFKSSLGFPSTKESTPWFQETSVKYNNYVNGEEILLDEIPSTPTFSITPNLADVNVLSSQLATGGYIKEDSTGVIRQYHRLILTPVPNSSNNSYYALDTNGNNILTDGLQFNTKWSGSGDKIYPYALYTQAFINADSNAPNELGQDSTGGNWLYDLKNGVIFFPDYSSTLCNGTTNKPVFSFYKYIGRKGVAKQIDFKNSLSDIPSDTKKYDKQIVVQTSDNTIHRYDSSTSSWVSIGGNTNSISASSVTSNNGYDSLDLELDDLSSNIVTNTSNITTNTSNITTNTSNITTNTSNISTNTSNISTNTSNITTNTSNITTNRSNITTNTGKLVGISYNSSTTYINGNLDFTGDLTKNGNAFSSGSNSPWETSSSNIYYNLGNIGIGTNSPSTLLVVGEDGGGHPTNIPGIHMKSIVGQTNKCYVVGQDTTHNVHLSYHPNTTVSNGYGILSCYGGSNNLAIQHGGGSVGIGTTSPQAKLHVSDSILIDAYAGNSNRGIFFRPGYTTNALYNISILSYKDGDTSGDSLSINAYDGITFCTGSNSRNERMRVSDNGNVGIGTASPGSKLEIFHKFSSATHTTLPVDSDNIGSNESVGLFLSKQWYNNTSFRFGLAMGTLSDGKSYIQSMSNTSTGRVLLLNPNSAGNVGIGTNSPTHPLHVNGYVYRADFGNYAATYWADNGSGRWNDDTNGTGNNAMSIKASHGILAMSGYWTRSDIRIKKNIAEIDDGSSLKKVRDISCVSYNYIDGTSRGTSLQVGFIAQQVMEHFPHAVSLDQGFIPDKLERITDASWNEINVISKNLVDISGVDISGIDISGIDISGVDISGVDISGVDISNIKYKLFSQSFVDVSGVNYRFYVFDSSNNEQVELDIMGNNDNSFTFEKKWNYVYCFGKEVHDLHILDKDKLFALNFSATQEIDRIQQHQLIDISQNKINIETLKIENDNLKLQNSTLTTKVNNLQNELNNLKSIVQDLIEAQMTS